MKRRGFFGKSLKLHAFRFDKTSAEWSDAGLVFDNTINNFPPLKLRTGDWMMSRRMFDYKDSGVHFLVGGVKSLSDWQSFPVLGSASELKAEEPDWWILPDNTLAAVFRDNRRSGFSLSRLFHRRWPHLEHAHQDKLPRRHVENQRPAPQGWPLRPRLESEPETPRSAHTLDQR